MKPYCIQPGIQFGPLNPRPKPASVPMTFAVGLRLLRSHSLSFSVTAPSRLLLARRVLEPRFISTVGPHQRRKLPAVRASSKQREGEEENGSLSAVKDVGRSIGEGGDGKIVVSELHKEATEAYMAYAMSVLLGRALPDVRDGLKPVHRRILWVVCVNFAMSDQMRETRNYIVEGKKKNTLTSSFWVKESVCVCVTMCTSIRVCGSVTRMISDTFLLVLCFFNELESMVKFI